MIDTEMSDTEKTASQLADVFGLLMDQCNFKGSVVITGDLGEEGIFRCTVGTSSMGRTGNEMRADVEEFLRYLGGSPQEAIGERKMVIVDEKDGDVISSKKIDAGSRKRLN